MSNDVNQMLDGFAVTLEFTVQEVNALLNVLNTPSQVPATTLVGFITAIQKQAGPQVEQAQANLKAVFEAAKNADGVPKDLEGKN
jgi:hypothetical protein